MSTVKNINDTNFDSEVLNAGTFVLVDFGAEWCGPCQRQAPILELFAKNNSEQVKVFKVDIDESPMSTLKYKVRSVPTLILFKNGKPLHTKVGLNSLSTLEMMLQSSI